MRWDLGLRPLNSTCEVDERGVQLAPVAVLAQSAEPLIRAIFSSDGKRLATAGAFGGVGVFDLETQQAIAWRKTHEKAVNDIVFDASGRFLFTGSSDGTVQVHNTADLQTLGTVVHDVDGAISARESQQCAPESTTGPAGGSSPLPSGAVACVAAPPHFPNTFFSGGADELIRCFDIRMLGFLKDVRAHAGPVTSLEFCGTDQIIMSTGLDGAVRFWDSQLLMPLKAVKGCGGEPLTHALTVRGGNDIVAISAGKSREIARMQSLEPGSFNDECRGERPPWNLVIVDDGPTFRPENTTHIKNGLFGPLVGTTPVERAMGPGPMVFGAYGSDLILIPKNSAVHVWDIAKRTYVGKQEVHSAPVSSAAAHPSGQIFASSHWVPFNAVTLSMKTDHT